MGSFPGFLTHPCARPAVQGRPLLSTRSLHADANIRANWQGLCVPAHRVRIWISGKCLGHACERAWSFSGVPLGVPACLCSCVDSCLRSVRMQEWMRASTPPGA